MTANEVSSDMTLPNPALELKYEDFGPRTIQSLSKAITSAFKRLEPIPQFRATAKLGEFLARFPQPFWAAGRCRPATLFYWRVLCKGSPP
jgi:hypothetical protein